MDNHSIIERIRKSDKNAFNQLFSKYYKRLCRFAYVIIRCNHSAEEIVQDIFVKLWEKREKLNVMLNLDSYLFVSVRNSSLNMLKFNQVRKNYCQDSDTIANVEENIEFDSATFLNQLDRAIANLPEQCRIIYFLKNFEGLTYDEIANYLDISSKTVENQVRIAMIKLREMLFQYKNKFYTEKL